MTVDKQRKKELSTAYAQSFRRMGIYQIRNERNGKILVGHTMDLDSARNRIEFMKTMKQNTIFELAADWNAFGGDAFVFEELDEIKPKEENMTDRAELKKYKEEVEALYELWLEKLEPYGDRGYNKKKRAP